VTAQLFSARTGEGVVAARARLRDLLNARLERALRIRE
jgi:hypothetical protein